MTPSSANGTAATISRTTDSPVAFLDLTALHAPLRAELDALWATSLDTSGFIGGAATADFEQAWAAYCGTDHCVGVANGTDAIELILQGLGVGAGDEVIVPTNTFVATAEAVVTVGATPVFVDVDPGTLLITAPAIEAALTPRTRAVMVVHLYGQIPDMDAIAEVCDRNGVLIVEDAAQAHGACYGDKRAGSLGRAASFSFYPGKNLGALGDGGAVVTDDAELAETIRTLANHGRGNHLLHVESGRNSRLDALQAGALALKLPHLDRWNDHRRRVHAQYLELFAGTDVVMLATVPGTTSVHHLEVARVAERDAIRDFLAYRKIGTGIHYALPCHQQPAFEAFAPPHGLPVAERAASTQMSLPMHPTLTASDVERVAEAVLEAIETPASTRG